MKYYILAGERSGDLHASNLVKSLKAKDPNAIIRGMGGALMKEAGTELFCEYNKVSYMGFLEVFLNIFSIIKVLKSVKQDILNFQPNVVILVDFAGFNMKIASFAKQHNFKTFYYISPKIWAWNQNRALKIKKCIDKMFVILPFEKDFYKKFNFEVDYVGNPVNDAIANFIPNSSYLKKINSNKRPIIALLPGSRKQEVENMIQLMQGIHTEFPDYDFVIAGVSNLSNSIYNNIQSNSIVKLYFDQTYEILMSAEAAIVTSGTATLETAIFNIPQIVVYKTSAISYTIAKKLIRVKYISLVNLIAQKEVVKELIQDNFTKENVIAELKKILPGGISRENVLSNYLIIKQKLGDTSASSKTASLMVDYLNKN